MIPAARLHGPSDIRVDQVPHPGEPPPGHVLLRVEVVGICGSDLHTYRHARIGDTQLASPADLGPRVCRDRGPAGPGLPGRNRPAAGYGRPGGRSIRAPPCGRCEWCQRGDPNLCPHIVFCGLFPAPGRVAALDARAGGDVLPRAARHGRDHGHHAGTTGRGDPCVGSVPSSGWARRWPVPGAGPIGLCLLRLAVLAGAGPRFAADPLHWRARIGRRRFGLSTAFCSDQTRRGGGGAEGDRRPGGVDVAFEAAAGG